MDGLGNETGYDYTMHFAMTYAHRRVYNSVSTELLKELYI